MKKYIYLLTILGIHNLINAQVGIGTTNPNTSSALEINSTNKGLLVPRMTQAQKNAITTPANGLMIYQTDGISGFYYYNGSIWLNIGASSGWNLTGNSGTTPASNKIGTSDNQDLSLVTNNSEAMRITSNGNNGIGTNTPSTKLHIVGSTPASQILNDGFEDNTVPPFTTNGNANWNTQNSVTFSGSRACKAGNITHSESTNLDYTTTTIPAQGAILSFYYKIESESCCDKLRLFVDGTEVSNWGGTIAWTQYTYTLSPGIHTLRWQYSKDSSVSTGVDTAYLDDILILNNALAPLRITDGNQSTGKILVSDATGTATWTTPSPVTTTDFDWVWNSGSTNNDPIYHVGRVFIGSGTTTTTNNLQIWNGNTTGTRADIASVEYLMDDTNEIRFSDMFSTQNDAGQDLGSSTLRWTAVYAGNGTIQTSDIREKEKIEPMSYGLNEILKLRPVTFKWKNEFEDNFKIPSNMKETKIGFIAQEIQKVIPEAIADKEWYLDGEHPEKGIQQIPSKVLGVDYSKLIAVTIKAIQEQQKEIEELNKTNQILENKIKELKSKK